MSQRLLTTASNAMLAAAFLVAGGVGLLVADCGDDAATCTRNCSPPPACTPGAVETCTCEIGAGIRICSADGSGFGACESCEGPPPPMPLALSFRVAPSYPAGSAPIQLAAGDLDGDGRDDIVVGDNGNGSSGGVAVLFSQPDGSLQKKVSFTGESTGAGSLADLDGDGHLDILVAASDGVFVHLNKGAGTFKPATKLSDALGTSIATGDVNGDGKVDVVLAEFSIGDVVVLPGVGDGTFLPPLPLAAGMQPSGVALGDVDGDGVLDLVVAGSGSQDVNVLLGAGDGTFGAPLSYPLGTPPWAITLADLTGDGKPDVIAGNANGETLVLSNLGDGTLAPPESYPSGGSAPAVGDFDGDGALDLAVANGGSVAVLENQGDGALLETREYAAGKFPTAVASADTDADGKPDLVVANLWGNDVSVLAGDGDATFNAAPFYRAGTTAMALGDVDGDGRRDLAAVELGPTLSVRLGQPNGDFGPMIESPSESSAAEPQLAMGDIDGDGHDDAIVSAYWGASTLRSRGDGTFDPPVPLPMGGNPVSIAVADVDGDGHLDIIAALNSGEFHVRRNHGDGSFDGDVGYATATPLAAVALGDLNGDGRPDIVTRPQPGYTTVGIELNAGDGTFGGASGFSFPATRAAIADLDGDGFGDLVLADGTQGEQAVVTMHGHGDGTFDPPVNAMPPYNIEQMVLGDLDGDGLPDLVIANDYTLDIYVNRGGLLQMPSSFTVGSGPFLAAIGDIDGDGLLDVAAASSDGIGLLINTSH